MTPTGDGLVREQQAGFHQGRGCIAQTVVFRQLRGRHTYIHTYAVRRRSWLASTQMNKQFRWHTGV